MSELVKKNANLLKSLNKTDPKVRSKILKHHCCNPEFVRCISNCSSNILKGNVPLTHSQMSKLRLKKKDLREISHKKTSLKKKAAIIQKGGFIGAILPPIIGALGSLFGGLLGGRNG